MKGMSAPRRPVDLIDGAEAPTLVEMNEGDATAIARERAALLALLLQRPDGLTSEQIIGEVIEAGSADAVLHNRIPPQLFADDDPAGLQQAVAMIGEWSRRGLNFRFFTDPDYPRQLREIHQAPPLVFTRGTVRTDDDAVAVVGTRDASRQGRAAAGTLAEALVAENRTVVSGLAVGIDTAAHSAALRAGGRTAAVLGTGITRSYPSVNAELQERIGREGLLLSQFWPDAPPRRHSFLQRNATISGYGQATVIVEAAEGGGSRAQARLSREHGRPVILLDSVVRSTTWGRELSQRRGVHIATSSDEVLDLLDAVVWSRPEPFEPLHV